MDIIVAGDVNLDIIPGSIDRLPEMGQELFIDNMTVTVGGSAANTAMGLAKLGLKVALYGVVSNDQFGKYIVENLNRTGVDTSLLEVTNEQQTGISICITSGKDRSFISYMGNNKLYNPQKLLEKNINASHIHITGFNWKNLIDNYNELFKGLKERDLTVSLDLGYDEYDKYADKMKQILGNVDLFFPNELEALILTESKNVYEALEKLNSLVTVAVITRGDKGVVAKDSDGLWEQPAFKVDAVDAVGAGDAFGAGFLYGYLNNLTTKNSIILGSACGAMAASNYGGGAAAPDIKALINFLDKHGCDKLINLKNEVV